MQWTDLSKEYFIAEARCILEQMMVGAGRLAKLLVEIAIIVGIIGLLYLLFKSGIVPTINLKTAKHAGDIVKPIIPVWM